MLVGLSLLAIPASATSGDVLQVMECDVLLGTGVLLWESSGDVGGLGGCYHGIAQFSGLADIDEPDGCRTAYDDPMTDITPDGWVEDHIEEGWEIITFCDAGVVNAHITVRILEQ